MKEVARDKGSSDPDGFSAMILDERSYGCSRLQPTPVDVDVSDL